MEELIMNNRRDHRRETTAEAEEHNMILPGFRFHPTDEELVGFYLRRKVVNKPIGLDIIKQIDIYKYDPWDLPKSTVGVEKEWYFFCPRARKYRNSVRPNRVTGSGFWKATGIDKQVWSSTGRNDCIGLKKSLVYYRGSAGKGVKTDWMMHEFRLPPEQSGDDVSSGIYEEAQVWTICRIFKRNVSNMKQTQSRHIHSINAGPRCGLQSNIDSKTNNSFDLEATTTSATEEDEKKHVVNSSPTDVKQQVCETPSLTSSRESCSHSETEEITNIVNWDELGRIMEFVFEPAPSDHFYF